jgi:hypothetical protein
VPALHMYGSSISQGFPKPVQIIPWSNTPCVVWKAKRGLEAELNGIDASAKLLPTAWDALRHSGCGASSIDSYYACWPAVNLGHKPRIYLKADSHCHSLTLGWLVSSNSYDFKRNTVPDRAVKLWVSGRSRTSQFLGEVGARRELGVFSVL